MPFRVLGMSFGFVAWLAYYGAMSQVNLADIGSDSMFAGTTMRSLACPDSRLQEAWEHEWEHSLSAKAHIPAPDLWYLVAGMWAFSLLQILWPVCRTATWADTGYENAVLSCFADKGGSLETGDILFAVADANGMATLGSLLIPCGAQSIKKNLEGRVFYVEDEAANVAVKLRTDVLERIFLSWLGENCLQLNLQGSLYMLNRHLGASATAQIQALASLMIGIAMS